MCTPFSGFASRKKKLNRKTKNVGFPSNTKNIVHAVKKNTQRQETDEQVTETMIAS